MWEHIEKHQLGERPEDSRDDFGMKLEKINRDSLRRMVREFIRIRRTEEKNMEAELMNTHGEWFIPKLVGVSLTQF